MRFSTKLVLLVSGLVIAGGAVQALLYGASSTRSLEAQIVERLEDRAFHTIDKLDRYFYERYLEGKALADEPLLRSKEVSPRQIAARMLEYLHWHREYASTALYGMDRVLVADTAPGRVGELADLEPAWAGIAAGRDCVVAVSLPRSDTEPMVLVAILVKDGRDARGLLVSRLPLGILAGLVGGVSGLHGMEEPLQIDLVDRTGLTLYSSYNAAGILRDISSDWSFIEPRVHSGQAFGHLKYTNPGETTGEELLFFIREHGFREYPGNGWTLSVDIPTAVAFAPAVALRNWMTGLLLFVGSALLAIVFFLVRAFTRPIGDLDRAAREIGRGNLAVRVPAGARDELGLFAETFNRMAADMQESQRELTEFSRELEGLVEERTAELLRMNEMLHAELSERVKAQEALLVRERLLQLNADIGEALTLEQTLEATLQRCADLLERNLDAAFVRIWTLGAEEDLLELKASAGKYTRLDGQHSRKVVGELKIGIIAKEQRPLLTNEVLGDPAFTDQEWARREGMVAFAGQPLVVAGKTVGVLALFARRPLEPYVLAVLAVVADKIALYVGRKGVEVALRASERRYRDLFDSSIDGVYTVDAAGIFTSMNPAGARIFGYESPDGIVGRPALDYWRDPGDRETFLKELKAKKALSAYPMGARKRNGAQLELESSAHIIEDESGGFLGIQGVLRDVTARVRAAAERELLLAQLQEAAANIRTLSGLLPICAGCKKIRDDKGSWSQIETYISSHMEVEFSHGLCPECQKVYFPGITGKP